MPVTKEKKMGRPSSRLDGVSYVKLNLSVPESVADKLQEMFIDSKHKSKGSLLTEILTKALKEAGHSPNLPSR